MNKRLLLSFVGRVFGVGIGLGLTWFSWAILQSRNGFYFIEKQDESARQAISEATGGLADLPSAPVTADLWGDLGMAFSILFGLLAAVVLIASVFPYEAVRRWQDSRRL